MKQTVARKRYDEIAAAGFDWEAIAGDFQEPAFRIFKRMLFKKSPTGGLFPFMSYQQFLPTLDIARVIISTKRNAL